VGLAACGADRAGIHDLEEELEPLEIHAKLVCVDMRILHGLGWARPPIITPMTRSWGQLSLLKAALLGTLGCSQASPPGKGDSQIPDLSRVSAVEVTTVTTVQASTGIFLSPRPQQVRPAYVERGEEGAAGVAMPSVELDRAKVDSALLFSSAQSDAAPLQLSATFSALGQQGEPLPQHFFPALEAEGSKAGWALELRNRVADDEPETWTEWGGWQAFGGLGVGATASNDAAPAATLDYELLGLSSPVVLTAEGDDIVITNRSDQPIAKVMLVYSHADGVGITVVADLGPGMRRETMTGPKEHDAEELLQHARGQLEEFFGETLGPELGRAVARAKSVPFLETRGLRLIYLLDEQRAPAAIALPQGLRQERRFVISHAEVLAPADEHDVLGLLEAGVEPSEIPSRLGRFARAKLEVARLLGNEQVQQQSSQLLESLTE
jgi:hypothetical protein